MTTTGDLRVSLRIAHKTASWAVVGEKYNIPGGTAYRIANTDYEPKRPDIRFRLGLPALVPAPVCRHCGQLHLAKRCTAKPRRYRDLFDIPTAELRRMMENRL